MASFRITGTQRDTLRLAAQRAGLPWTTWARRVIEGHGGIGYVPHRMHAAAFVTGEDVVSIALRLHPDHEFLIELWADEWECRDKSHAIRALLLSAAENDARRMPPILTDEAMVNLDRAPATMGERTTVPALWLADRRGFGPTLPSATNLVLADAAYELWHGHGDEADWHSVSGARRRWRDKIKAALARMKADEAHHGTAPMRFETATPVEWLASLLGKSYGNPMPDHALVMGAAGVAWIENEERRKRVRS